MRGEVHILVYCPIDTLQWGSTHSALGTVAIVQRLVVAGCGFFSYWIWAAAGGMGLETNTGYSCYLSNCGRT